MTLIDSKKILPERNRPNRNSLTSDLVGSVKDVDLMMMMMRQKLDAQDQGKKMELAMMTSSAFDAYTTFNARILVSTTVTRNQATSNSRFFPQKPREDQSIAIVLFIPATADHHETLQSWAILQSTRSEPVTSNRYWSVA